MSGKYVLRWTGQDITGGDQIDYSTEQFEEEGGGPGVTSFLKVVLLLFLMIVVLVAGMAFFGTDDGMLPFDYEGF